MSEERFTQTKWNAFCVGDVTALGGLVYQGEQRIPSRVRII